MSIVDLATPKLSVMFLYMYFDIPLDPVLKVILQVQLPKVSHLELTPDCLTIVEKNSENSLCLAVITLARY